VIDNAENLTIPDTFNWSGGTIRGTAGQSFTTPAGSVVTASASSTHVVLDTVNMQTEGDFDFTSSFNDFILDNDAQWTVDSLGVLNILNTNGSADILDRNSTVASLINLGTMNVAPSSNIDIFTLLDNQGLIEVQTGIMEINNPSTSSGMIDVLAGATFLIGSGTSSSLTLSGTPLIGGSGTFSVDGNTVFDVA
ncbi:MAG: hypothetical protein GY746_07650, partial [Gammaproteobacteria bacterium]|nr:hypothetical protein [Gammaproteobacteria bacterium]